MTAESAGRRNFSPASIRFDDGLPISARREEIARAIEAHQVVIVCGETGSGKTTQLPKICLALGRGRRGLIGHTQPRRIAASSVARRIAAELGTELGEVVGYKVRFADQTRPGVQVKLMTDGILLAEIHSDPKLRGYDTIIVDEAHERSLNIDFLLGYLVRLMPARPDLKLLITSATIDAERFARHFGSEAQPAPVLKVSGRLYPVDVRYRPFEDEGPEAEHEAAPAPRRREAKTQIQAVLDAVDEVSLQGIGDTLVFLPGEREIRETAEALRKHHPAGTEILPLYARLSAEEQERIFEPGARRRIVLATNIAETSLTVPGIRYVVDSGQARVKRYSYRNKVEQLRIEPISRAAAEQRAGRCGRVAAGVCIRLYAESEFAARPQFTDPEVMRSSLAAVILRMSVLDLGEPGKFPFIDAPPARAIADGYQLLAELNAVDERNQLTELGRALARLPVDPRIGRILMAARDQNCLAEALVIASALSIQDPRERPAGMQPEADAAHKRHADPRSDFLSFVHLWNALAQRWQHKKSNRKLADELRAEFIHVRRVREWRDVHGQLAELVGEQGWRVNPTPATFEQVHGALLAGLIGNIGMRSADADPADRREPPYTGARAIRFFLWPGASRGARTSPWVVAAELVETSRLFARTIAAVEPAWIERAGAHLLRRSHGDPRWDRRGAQVVAMERGTIHGLPVYVQRRVSFGAIDPALSRRIFLREALVNGQFDTAAPFLEHNRKLVAQIREMEHRTRRPDILVDEDEVFAFYDGRIPEQVRDGAGFEHWRKGAEKSAPRLLFLSREQLMRHEAGAAATEFFPKHLRVRGEELALTYHFEPGSARDGVTLTVPLAVLNQVDPRRCEWLVPGMRKEKTAQLLRSLPQRLRRACVPIEAYATGFLDRAKLEPQGLVPAYLETLIADIRSQTGVVCTPGDFRPESLAPHLSMNFKVVDANGRQLAMGRNIAALRAELASELEASFRQAAAATPQREDATPITDWDFGDLPQVRELRQGGQVLLAYPALVDAATHCLLQYFDEPEAALGANHGGLRRLFRLQLRQQVSGLEKSLSSLAQVQMRARTTTSMRKLEPLSEQVVQAALERVCLAQPWPRDRAAFHARRDEARGRLGLIAQEIARLAAQVVEEAVAVERKLTGVKGPADARADIEQQMARLLGANFVADTPPQMLAHLPRYLKAIGLRLEKLRTEPARDAERYRQFAPLHARWQRELGARKGHVDAKLAQYRWQLEELRVSLFAQELRTPYPVSVKRLEKIWSDIGM